MKTFTFILLFILPVVCSAQNLSNSRKLEIELSASESINATVSFKFGVSLIYGIVSGGIVHFDNYKHSAIGLGIGTQHFWQNDWTNEIELLGYTMSRDGGFGGDMSMLAQLRFTVGKQFTRHFKIYCGPTINTTILKYKDVNCNFLNDIAPYSLWKKNNTNSKIDGWVGIVGGIRF